MDQMGLRPDRGHVKSQRVVGEVMGKLHLTEIRQSMTHWFDWPSRSTFVSLWLTDTETSVLSTMVPLLRALHRGADGPSSFGPGRLS